ncbi:potassium channel protein, partial [Thermococci archaeon]
ADNVYIILTARGLNTSLKIFSRAAEERAVKKM